MPIKRSMIKGIDIDQGGPKQEEKRRRREGRDSSSTTAGVPPDRHLTPEFCRISKRRRSSARPPTGTIAPWHKGVSPLVKSGASSIKKKTKKIRTSVTFHRPKTLNKPGEPKYPTISALPRNKLNHYQILKYPLTTESAMKKIEDNKLLSSLLTFELTRRRSRLLSRRCMTFKPRKPDGTKKAYVRLTPDYDALGVANKIGII
ncbi:hypothetical protein M5K25_001407 [Dendrobium thyrsiflorum]|uniref:Large ribosomal subunit protein uL23 N-terminal domain-containing protein n=1 Tax=Dendrobium thyrsiflorum TaxID=117978 RepID=A0ABD0VRP9_DENTH